MKWNWAGHIHRRDNDRWTRKITEWKSKEGRRAVGRPKLRWSDDINNFIKEKTRHLKDGQIENWSLLAPDKNNWSTLGKAYIQLCMK